MILFMISFAVNVGREDVLGFLPCLDSVIDIQLYKQVVLDHSFT